MKFVTTPRVVNDSDPQNNNNDKMATNKRKLPSEEWERNTALRLAVKSFPARSWRELDRVGEALLGRGDAERAGGLLSVAEALHIVDIWRLRQSNLPHAIECTASIAAILSKEDQYTEHEQRLLLSAVVTRSVNGLADVLQRNRAVAASVAGLCAQLGMPAWIVQLRHEATHQELPPLPTLRMGATSLLSFLDSIFWTPLRQTHDEAYHGVMAKLKNFEKEVNKHAPPLQTDDKKNDLSTGTRDIDDDGDTSSSEDDDPFGLATRSCRLGSNKNQFALLQYKKKKIGEGAMTKKKQKKKKMATKLTPVASDIIVDCSRDLPPDILFQALLDFLVGQGTGVLVTTAPLPPYRFLLKAMGQVWPGFLPTLLVHCVQVSTESVALATVKFLCSKALVKLFDKTVKGDGDDHAPAVILLSKLHYPLNSLCDDIPVDTPLQQLLLDILGTERVPGYGIFTHATTRRAATGESLDGSSEMLQLLPHPPPPPQPTTTLVGGKAEASPWKQCVNWEPCPLGSLPTDLY
jgi:Las1-like